MCSDKYECSFIVIKKKMYIFFINIPTYLNNVAHFKIAPKIKVSGHLRYRLMYKILLKF